MFQNKLPNLQTRLNAACVSIAGSPYEQTAQEQLERLVIRLELYAEAATGKRTARASAMQKRSSVVPFGHPDRAVFDRLNAIEDRDQGI